MKLTLSAPRAELAALARLVPALAPQAEHLGRLSGTLAGKLTYRNPQGEPLEIEAAVTVEE